MMGWMWGDRHTVMYGVCLGPVSWAGREDMSGDSSVLIVLWDRLSIPQLLRLAASVLHGIGEDVSNALIPVPSAPFKAIQPLGQVICNTSGSVQQSREEE